jgi:hypothetical protein
MGFYCTTTSFRINQLTTVRPIVYIVETYCMNYGRIQKDARSTPSAPDYCSLGDFSRWLCPECGDLGTAAPFSGGGASPASCRKRVTTGPRAKWLSMLLWSAHGLCLIGSNQSKTVYPMTCWRFFNGLPRSKGFSPGRVWRMAKTWRSPGEGFVVCGWVGEDGGCIG